MTPAVRAAWLLSIGAWLIPILVLQLVRSRRDRPLEEIALDIPLAVALDILGVLVASRFVHLEMAALASRPAWIVGGTAFAVYRWRRHGWRPRWPQALGAGNVLAAMGAAALAVAVYSGVSFKYHNADYGLHMSNVSAMASQKLPFINALSGTQVLHYHFGGDVLAAIIRTQSLDVISSMRALHTGHDAMMAAMSVTVALLSMGLGLRRRLSAALGGLAIVLQGPIPLRGHLGHAIVGYAYQTFPNLSYRAHIPLAGLMLVGAFGTVAVRAVRRERLSAWVTGPTLLAVIAVLAVTDEASTALVCLALGVAWLVDPSLLAARRWTALVLLLGLGIAFVGANLLFAASLAPGSPVHSVTFTTAARVPPLLNDPELPLSEPHGWWVFFMDYLPLLACALALTLLAFRLRSPSFGALVMLVWALVGISAALVLRVEVNHAHNESQRYFMAPFFACLVFAVVFLDRMPRGSLMATMALLGVAAPPFYAIYWLQEETPTVLAEWDDAATNPAGGLHDLDCRAVADAHFGDTPRVAYVESSEYYRVTACRPVFQSSSDGDWPIPVKPTIDPTTQLRNLDANLVARADETQAICLRDPKANSDVVCKRALRVRTSCRPYGSRYLICPLTPSDRDELLRR